jgi:signal transduction histidine kinase
LAGPGRRRADQLFITCLGIFRAVQIAQSGLVVIVRHDQYRLWWPVVGALVVVACWSAVLYVTSRRLGWVPSGWYAVDAMVAIGATLLVESLCLPTEVETWTNWAFLIGCNSAMLSALAFPAWAAMAMSGVLLVVGLAGAASALATGQASISNAVGNSATYVGLTAMAVLGLRYLRQTGHALDEANDATLAAEVARAAERARYEDRLTQYRTLHDTVLSTLTAISRGGLDVQLPAVRARATREADYLRRLLMGDVAVAPARTLHEALNMVIEDVAALGLCTHYLTDSVPITLPPSVVTAIAEATREALTNVVRHSGTNEAWLTSIGEVDGTVIVRVADRGNGFYPDQVTNGFGLERSIRDRLTIAGGATIIDSHPGEGTLVDLRWSPQTTHPVSGNGAGR